MTEAIVAFLFAVVMAEVLLAWSIMQMRSASASIDPGILE
jgi:hypothetical protein